MNHSYSVETAMSIGIPSAVLLEYINYWIQKNKANNKHFYDGCYWTYNSVKAFGELFPEMSSKQIRSALERLQVEGIIKTGNYSKNPYDRTNWYALTKKGESICLTGQMKEPYRANENADEGECKTIKNTIKEPVPPEAVAEQEAFNPFGDGDYELDTSTVEAYASTHLHHLSPTNMEELVWFKTKMQDDLIRYAIDEACAQGVRTFAYVRSILNRCVRDEIKSLDEIKAVEERRSREQGKQDEAPDQPVRWLA